MLLAVVLLAVLFDYINGFHDTANAIATSVSTRALRPDHAILMSASANFLGALTGTAVAKTIASGFADANVVTQTVVLSALTGACIWNLLTWWWGLPSSSSHALVGGLVGAALVHAGAHAVRWGGFDGWRPVGVLGFLLALTISPLLGFGVGFVVDGTLRAVLVRATRRVYRPIRGGEWATSASLAFANGANDASKAMGVVAALLLAAGRTSSLSVPLWVRVTSGLALTLGTAVGGWALVRTIGRRIYRIRPVDGLAAQSTSTAVVVASSFVGAPVSTTQVLASSVVGIGVSRRRFRHVNWRIVATIVATWVTTLPASAAIAAIALPIWRW